MKVIDSRNTEFNHIVQSVDIYPFLDETATERDMGFSGVIEAIHYRDHSTPQVRFNIQMNTISVGALDDLIKALQYVRQCADIELLTNPEKPLPKIESKAQS